MKGLHPDRFYMILLQHGRLAKPFQALYTPRLRTMMLRMMMMMMMMMMTMTMRMLMRTMRIDMLRVMHDDDDDDDDDERVE